MNRQKARGVAAAKPPRATDYLKIVEWSEEDGCFVGSAPPIIGPACHGPDEVKVYRELCGIVEEWLYLMDHDGLPVPAPTAQRSYSGKFNLRAGKELHKALEIRATQAGESLNAYCIKKLRAAVGRRPAPVQSTSRTV